MWGVLLVGLIIVIAEWVVAHWPILLIAGVIVALWLVAQRRVSLAAQREAREMLRHERARQEIDRIALETSRNMYVAALAHEDVIEGTAVEVVER